MPDKSGSPSGSVGDGGLFRLGLTGTSWAKISTPEPLNNHEKRRFPETFPKRFTRKPRNKPETKNAKTTFSETETNVFETVSQIQEPTHFQCKTSPVDLEGIRPEFGRSRRHDGLVWVKTGYQQDMPHVFKDGG